MKRYRSTLNKGATQSLLKELLTLDLENFLKMTVSVHFLIDSWMDSKDVIIKRCRSSLNMDAARLLLEKLLPLDLENLLEITVSVHFLCDGLMDSNYIMMYHEGIKVKFKYGCTPIIIGGS
jgi:hypothetical protein